MRRFVIFGAVIAAVVLIWSAGWLYLSNEIRNQVELLAQNDGYEATQVTCGELAVGGYPFRFNLTCSAATVVSGDVTARIPTIEAAALIFQPTLYHVRAIGPMTIEDAFLGGRNEVTWINFEGSLRLADWKRIGRLSVIADNVAWNDTLVTTTLVGSATHAELHLVDVPEKHDATTGRAALEGYAHLAGTAMPAWKVANGEITAAVEVSALPDNLMALPFDPWQDWQAAGGRLAITEIKGVEGEDTITVTGDLALNAEAFPEGIIEIASKGIVERSTELVAPEMLPLIFGSPGEDGTYRQRLTIANGYVFVGMLPAFAFGPFF